MQVSRSRGLQAARHALASSSRQDVLNRGDRYKVIRSFFLRQEQVRTRTFSTVERVPRAAQTTTSLFSTIRPTNLCYTRQSLLSATFRTFHLTCFRLQQSTNEKDGTRTKEDSGKERPNEDSNITKHDDPSRYAHLENYSRFFRRLAMSLPGMPARPTRDDLLNVATNFWQRLRIRFKWFTIKSFRKFNADDMSAFFTWFLMSQTVWILVGT